MSKEERSSSRSRSKSKDGSEKRKKSDSSKVSSSSKEPKGKEVKANGDISKKKKIRKSEAEEKEDTQATKKLEKYGKKPHRDKKPVQEDTLLSNSIDKLRRPTASSKILRPSSKITFNQVLDVPAKKPKRPESRKSAEVTTEKRQRSSSRHGLEDSRDEKIRKSRSKSSINQDLDNPIDKIRRPSSGSTKSSRPSSRNLTAQNVPLLKPSTSSKALPTSSKPDEYNYEDDFEEYTDDFEEETEKEEDKDESSEVEDEAETSSRNKPKSEPKPLTVSQTKDKMLTDKDLSESNIDSPLLRRIMNRRQPSAYIQDSSAQSFLGGGGQRPIDFANATTTTNWGKISEVQRRYGVLKNLIGMEITQIDLLDHHPIREYDFYVKMFGNTDYMQVQTQTGDDDLDRYIQTEDADQETVWTQIPYSDPQGWGTATVSNGSNHYQHLNVEDPELERLKAGYFHADKFRKFISIAGQVFIDIMQTPSFANELSLQHQTSLKFSKGYSKFSIGHLANAAKVTSMEHQENSLFIAFYIKQTTNEDIANKSVIVEFDIGIPNTPQRIMLCDNEVRCMCTSPDSCSAVFAGLNDSSCVAFDLKESSSLFASSIRWSEDGKMYPLRTAAYDTSFKAVTNKTAEGQYALVAITKIPNDTGSSETYQLVSIDESGTVIVWTVINDESFATVGMDLGLRPGAQLKMTQTSMIRPESVLFSNLNSPWKTAVSCMLEVPTNPSQFLIGTDQGIIVSFVRSKAIKSIGPRIYRVPSDPGQEFPDELVEKFAYFQAGFSSGSLSLHEMNTSQPVLILEPPEKIRRSVLRIFFSPSNPTVFYTIHSRGLLLVWDLAQNKEPESVNDLNLEDDLDLTTAQLWMSTTPEKSSLDLLAIGFNNGEVQLHGLKKLSGRRDKNNDMSLSEAIKAFRNL